LKISKKNSAKTTKGIIVAKHFINYLLYKSSMVTGANFNNLYIPSIYTFRGKRGGKLPVN
jgi:hypothetical protein